MAVSGSRMLDVHAHYLPPSYRTALARAGIDRPDGFPHVPDWSAASALALMDEVGIGASLLSISSPGLHFLPPAERPPLARAVNEDGAEAVRAHPGRFGLLASLPLPDIEASLHEIAHAVDRLGADGFVVMTNYDGVYLGDPRLDPVMAELDRRGALVAIHPTSPAAAEATDLGRPRPMIEFPFDTTRAVVNLALSGTLSRHAAMRWIVPHVGSALAVLTDRVQGFVSAFAGPEGDAPDVFAALRRLWFDVTGNPFPHAFAALLRIADPERLLYGSDMPFAPPSHIARAADALRATVELSDEQRRGLLHENARGLVPRLGRIAA
jgi:predicted TIM-barrel fold metal-dependent hydrolase